MVVKHQPVKEHQLFTCEQFESRWTRWTTCPCCRNVVVLKANRKKKSQVGCEFSDVKIRKPHAKTEWETIMKHCAIKGVPVTPSGVWWAAMSLWSSGAAQLINHQGGARRECSLKSFITTLGGMQSPGHISVLLFPPPQHPQCWLLNQHARLPGKHCMESEVARGCNQKLSHVHCNSKFKGLYQDKLQQSSKWTWRDRKWKTSRSLAFWSEFP